MMTMMMTTTMTAGRMNALRSVVWANNLRAPYLRMKLVFIPLGVRKEGLTVAQRNTETKQEKNKNLAR